MARTSRIRAAIEAVFLGLLENCRWPGRAASMLAFSSFLGLACFQLGCSDRGGGALGGVLATNAGAGGSGGAMAAAGGGDAAGGLAGSGGMGLPADDVPVDFFFDIQPILTEYCVRCHGGVRELGMPVLNLQSREKAAFVLGQVGEPESSLLYLKVIIDDPMLRMPLAQAALSPESVNKLRRWIFQGAPWPAHWAFAPNSKPDPNAVAVTDEAWVKNPLDRFVLAKLEAARIPPSPEANKHRLLRRVSLDLTGLPPSPGEIAEFVSDASADAYTKVVDRLLASPAYGERWARHWLDQARYADSEGFQEDHDRPQAYKWRDWVIQSINADQPFDEFTRDQIAGDLLPDATQQQVAATGFHAQTLFNHEGGIDREEDRTKTTIDRVATVGQTWLGLTLGCAQCHSHAYDRISHKEFFNFYALFNNTDDNWLLTGQDSSEPRVTERTSARRTTHLLVRGDFMTPDKTEAMPGGTPSALHAFAPRGPTPDRLDLANWLVSPENSLTPRVIVNSVWSHLFGAGLVHSLEDFGARAKPPSHPLLLDWLAKEFERAGWSRKQLLRTIVSSATYRQDSQLRPDAAAVDADNLLLHRQSRLRVDAEVVRDIFLGASGLLDRTVGGPSVYPPIPPSVLNYTFLPFDYPLSTGGNRLRRGMYTFHKRSAMHPNLELFDGPKGQHSENLRQRSNTPLQALVTLHNESFFEAAQGLAARVQQERPGDLKAQLELAFLLAAGRPPSAEDVATLSNLLSATQLTLAGRTADAEALQGAHAPPGVPAITAGAWVNVARVILNLDQVITRE